MAVSQLKAPLGESAIHLCVDMQRLFSAQGPWPTPWMERVLPSVLAVVEHAPARTIFTRFIPPLTAADAPGRWQAYYRKWAAVTRERIDLALLDLLPALAAHVPPACVFDKSAYSAFTAPALLPHLLQRGANTLIVTGSETDVCVLASVLAAIDCGFRVVIVRDGICSSADETHDALLTLYSNRFDVQLELADAAEIIEAWNVS
jgi:nicotinamidase-related amidase